MTPTQSATTEQIIIPQYSRDDFNTEQPYKWVMQFSGNEFEYMRFVGILSDQAANVGFRSFKSMLKAYAKKQPNNNIIVNNTIIFDDLPYDGVPELIAGDWKCTDYGVYGYDRHLKEEFQVCVHPLFPIQRIRNVDTGDEKIKLAYTHDEMIPRKWETLIVERTTIASVTSIVRLAAYGIGVTSENAKYFVRYLNDIIELNRAAIPTASSAGRLGWVQDGFIPYIGDIEFDGDESFRNIYKDISAHGSFTAWKNEIAKIRQNGNVFARTVLAASFASVIVKPCGLLNFFLHLWGFSGRGKTVALMLAASVWGSPAVGSYVRTFNSTKTALGLYAGFVNSLPIILDELQIIKDKRDFDEIIYMLSEGSDKGRGKKNGGLRESPEWRNCIITSGEYPITTLSSGSGAVNRVLELNCGGRNLFDDPIHLVDILTDNYGHAGKEWIMYLFNPDIMEAVKAKQKEIYGALTNATPKQRASASAILTADYFIEKLIFRDDVRLTADDLGAFLMTEEDLDQNAKALNYLYDYFEGNKVRFEGTLSYNPNLPNQSGKITDYDGERYICFISSVFDKIMRDGGYNARSFCVWAKDHNVLRPDANGRSTRPTYTSMSKQRDRLCWIKYPKDGSGDNDNDDLPL